MKKILALILALSMAFALAACGGNTEETTTNAPEVEATEAPTEGATVEVESALALLEAAWANHNEEEKMYFVGGDMNNSVEDAPGKFDLSDAEAVEFTLGIPQAEIAKVDDAASIMHNMNANNFTCGAYHVTDAANIQGLADALKEALSNKQWMCGFPELLYIASIGDYLVCAYGSELNITSLKADLTAAYGENVKVIYEESLVF